ncbi:MAG: hypothetical protein BWK76_01820 [Desulfobulbaceae bacterium A2]|nr:MAG: hypothetical protein BWK76_01820 [Desulfobulbaceae bacterium A2]
MNVPVSQTLVRRGKLIQLAVLIVLLLLVCGLLAANYSTQRSLQQSKLASLQTDFDDHALVVAHFLGERRNDLKEIAASRQVTAYFENRALGMTKAYGLRSSLNNSTQYLQQRWNASILLVEQIYVSLMLTDAEGTILTGWPLTIEQNDRIELPQGRLAAGEVRESGSAQGEHILTCPVVVNNSVVGYIQARIAYATIFRHFLHNTPGTLFFSDHQQVVFCAGDTLPLSREKLVHLAERSVSPLALSWHELAAPGEMQPAPGTRGTLLFKQVGDRQLRLYTLLHGTDLALARSNWVLFGALALFSLSVLLGVNYLIQTNINNLVLASSLDETKRRELAIAEKNNELELEIAQRRATEQQLVGQRALLRCLLDSIPDLIVYKDSLGRYLGCNRAFEEFIGHSGQNIIGKTDFDFFDPGAAASYQRHDRQALAEGASRRNEEAMLSAAGVRVQLDTLKTLYHGPQGEVLGIIGISRDISRRQQTENALRQAKAYAESVIRNFLDTLIVVNRSLRIETINQATCRLLGYQEDEVLDQPVEMLFADPPNRVREVFGFHHDAPRMQDLTTHELRNVELTYLTKAGQPCPMSFNVNLLSDDNGAITGVIAGAKDISALKRSEEQRNLQAAVIEQAHAAVVVSDTQGFIRYVNPAVERCSGFRREELIGARPSIFKKAIVPRRVFIDIMRALRDGHIWKGHFSSRHKDGTLLEQSATISPVRDDRGEISHFVAIMHDVSRESLLQRQLLQAQKLEAIGQLAAGISHEINTPIQYVQNNVTFFQQAIEDITLLLGDYDRLLQAEEADGAHAALLEAIRQRREEIDLDFLLHEIPAGIAEALEGIGRVVRIVTAMKEFSHPGSDRKTPTDLNKAIESTITVARNEWKYVAEMVTDLAPDLPPVPCLPDRWNQALFNLIVNAAHAIAAAGGSQEQGQGRITVSTRQLDADWVEIRVSDTGTGIPEKIRQRIFEPFFTTKEVGKGTGQGLTIVHDVVVKKLGGIIQLESEVGRGSTFIIRLPLEGSASTTTSQGHETDA